MVTNRSNITASVSKGPSKGAPKKATKPLTKPVKSKKQSTGMTQQSIDAASRIEDEEMAGAAKFKKGGKVMAKKGCKK